MPNVEDPFGPFNSDGEAVQFLESQKFLCEDGTIIPPGINYILKPNEAKAIEYLTKHWSWSYADL